MLGGKDNGQFAQIEKMAVIEPAAPQAQISEQITAEEAARQKRAEIARINGAKSHGPVTEEGKKKSSMNALKHGLCASHDLLIYSDSIDEFTAYKNSVYQHYRPTDGEEDFWVDRIVGCRWKLRRVWAMEAESVGPVDSSRKFNYPDPKQLGAFSRYEAEIERAMKRAMTELANYRKNKPETIDDGAPIEPPTRFPDNDMPQLTQLDYAEEKLRPQDEESDANLHKESKPRQSTSLRKVMARFLESANPIQDDAHEPSPTPHSDDPHQ